MRGFMMLTMNRAIDMPSAFFTTRSKARQRRRNFNGVRIIYADRASAWQTLGESGRGTRVAALVITPKPAKETDHGHAKSDARHARRTYRR
jgi:hypothetical protein